MIWARMLAYITGTVDQELAPLAATDLSKLVNLGAARNLISDARTTTYLILSTGSGPGGRWFKSTRPDHFF